MKAIIAFLVGLVVFFTAGSAHAQADVEAIARAEMVSIESHGLTIPPHALVTLDRYGTLGNAIILERPVRHVIVLWDRYWSDDQAHFVAAHELGHLVLDHYGVTQDEALATMIAWCFGTPGARRWASIMHGASGPCGAVRALLLY